MINNGWCSLFLSSSLACPAQNIKVNWATNNTGGMRKDTSSEYIIFLHHWTLKLQTHLLLFVMRFVWLISLIYNKEIRLLLCYFYLVYTHTLSVFWKVLLWIISLVFKNYRGQALKCLNVILQISYENCSCLL